ncbi:MULTISPECIES: diaminobutyrate--2-oxoglutarate transaminase [Moorena]|uniref:Diaminobutyrate--2-oxoglutarate transaminase n=3 Tax=Moorena TaxID=1155738 RepID=A0A1D9FT12_MOOP1|nr:MULTISPECIES: diaminobutyrate--2-oxoglutarate transaminase [Moorena]NEQ15850.1 diaminobutyrate--2-oxoglutarate transaminase [Moorena sp. SIO3E2]NES86187.1 diaminobutyrate--2-oxoglutarate transaminase [Moorena sp. SIO2B7]AOY78506.1 diaminobutyrate--2-oxoglutarate transaminase [Moorena producens JHB]EGJ34919.1 diaminobutyrate aminotransferase apoenzyme [Moorena producens 3L]NEP68498.1 diaminobutyrate--2-oxoglutarate transaminase [Moorena sp. SIO3A5]
MNIFTKLESEVRSYCRLFPTVFTKAVGDTLIDESGRTYIDFLAGAGALNYGHNNPKLKKRLLEYIESDAITHSLDMFTSAKQQFLERFDEVILIPRGLNYKVMFTGPTGTNSAEAALKLARKVTGRKTVICFTKGYHGHTLGALAVTPNPTYQKAAGIPLGNVLTVPFEDKNGTKDDSLDYLEKLVDDLSINQEKPAAVILETVQSEGGINVASVPWLQRLAQITQEREILLIVDDIKVGCGRTGPFFSFERAGLKPDLVCLAKSLSAYGNPMAVVLIRPDLDCWKPGEHSGTFRGNNLAFVTATAALDEYWETDTFTQEIADKGEVMKNRLKDMITRYPEVGGEHRGLGLIQGIACEQKGLAKKVSNEAFKRGLIFEPMGVNKEVINLQSTLTIDPDTLTQGLDILEESIGAALSN